MKALLLCVAMAGILWAEKCPNCATEVEKKWKFCPKCGAAMPDHDAAADEAAARADEKRKELIASLRELKQACEKAGQADRAARVDSLIKTLSESKIGPEAGAERGDVPGVGAGSGTGGKFAWRVGQRKSLVTRNGGSVATEAAVMSGLKWLARHQNEDGSWSADGFSVHCNGAACDGNGYVEYKAAATGLAILAYLGAGYLPDSKEAYDDVHTKKPMEFGLVVDRACRWLLRSQGKDGNFGDTSASKNIYAHAIATAAMVEAYGMTLSPEYQDSAKKAISYLQDCRNTGRAWRYSRQSGDNDTSVTGWCVMALKSAQAAGLEVAPGAYDGVRRWLTQVTDPKSFKVGYNAPNTGKVVVQGHNETWDGHEALAAVGMVCRLAMDGDKTDPAIEGGARLLAADLPAYAGAKVDYYYWYYGTMAMFHCAGPDGNAWKTWNEAVKKALVGSQLKEKDGCTDGSWDVEIDRWGFEGGRMYTTALNVLTLETCYRYPAGFGKKK